MSLKDYIALHIDELCIEINYTVISLYGTFLIVLVIEIHMKAIWEFSIWELLVAKIFVKGSAHYRYQLSRVGVLQHIILSYPYWVFINSIDFLNLFKIPFT